MAQERLPILTARHMISILEHLGFKHRKLTATSHRRYIHPDGRRTTIPVHHGQDIGRGLLRKILKDVEISPDELRKLMYKGNRKGSLLPLLKEEKREVFFPPDLFQRGRLQ